MHIVLNEVHWNLPIAKLEDMARANPMYLAPMSGQRQYYEAKAPTDGRRTGTNVGVLSREQWVSVLIV